MPNIKSGPKLALGSLLSLLKTPTPRAVHSQATQGSRLEAIESVLSHLRCSKLFKNFLDFPVTQAKPKPIPDVDCQWLTLDRHWLAYILLDRTYFMKSGIYHICTYILYLEPFKCFDVFPLKGAAIASPFSLAVPPNALSFLSLLSGSESLYQS